jgi:uncharacterized alpha-E superfamily protein
MLCRVAEQMFWMSRYLERAISVSRMADVMLHLELDLGEQASSTTTAREQMTFGHDDPSALVGCVRNARMAARGIRESISSEMWEHTNTLFLSVIDPRLMHEAETDPPTFYKRLREGAQSIHGLADSTLAHGEDWHFYSLGKFLERADSVTRVLSLDSQWLWLDSTVRWLAVLRTCGSAEAYARYYSMRVEPARVIEFLLFNPIFPQSVRFSVNAAWSALSAIADDEAFLRGPNPALRALGLLRANVEHAAVDEVLELGLGSFLTDVQRRVSEVTDHVTRIYLRDQAGLERQMPAARAARIMAAQQQQQQ